MAKTAEQISYNMRQVKNKDSKIEVMLRKELWSRGLRYRKNVNSIYGKPDIAFSVKKLPFFVTANFGTDITGKNVNTILNHIKNSGFPK